MLHLLKTFCKGLFYLWNNLVRFADIFRSIADFPGVDDSKSLRTWLRPLVSDCSRLTGLTKNTIDDAVAKAAARVIDNDKAWDAVDTLVELVHEWPSEEGTSVPHGELQNKVAVAYYDAVEELTDVNPAEVIIALGLILEVIHVLRRQQS